MSDRPHTNGPSEEGVAPLPEPAPQPGRTDVPSIQGNRPAQDSVLGTPGSVLGKDWTGHPGATDFLGLDQEPLEEQPQAMPAAPAGMPPRAQPAIPHAAPPPAPPPAPMPTGALDSGVESGVFFDLDGGEAQSVGPRGKPAGSGITRTEAESALAGLDEEIDEALGTTPQVEASWSEPVVPARKPRKLLAVGVTAVVAVAGFFGYRTLTGGDDLPAPPPTGRTAVAPVPAGTATPDSAESLRSPGDDTGRQVAGRGGVRVPGTGAPEPADPTAAPGDPAPDTTTVQATPDVPTPRTTGTTHGWTQGGGETPGTYQPEPGTTLEGGGEPVASAPAPWGSQGYSLQPPGGASGATGETNPFVAGVDQRSTQLQAEDLFAGREIAGLRIATAQDMGSVWPNETIPYELVPGERKVLTPAVGNVRAILDGDEIFEGELYAVGQQTLWIQSAQGRVALPGARLRLLQRIDANPGAPVLGSTGSEDMAGLERVRVTVQGGSFFGKVIARDAERTIVITDSGARLTLRDADVEEIGKNPEVVIKSK